MPITTPMGKFGAIGFGKQTVVGTAVPAAFWVRKTSKGGAYPKITRVRTTAAFGTLDANVSDIVQRVAEFDFEFEPDDESLKLILEHMLGAAPVTNIITPAQNDWNALMPLVPLTVEFTTPGENYRVVDAQFTNLKLKWNPKGFVTASVTGKGLTIADLASPTTPVVPASAFVAQNVTMTLGGSSVIPETLELELDVPVEFVDGANGLTAPVGFARPAGDEMLRSFKANFSFRNLNTATKTSYETNTTPAAVLNFVRGTDIVRFNVGGLDIVERNLQTPNGPTMTQVAGIATTIGGWLTAAFV